MLGGGGGDGGGAAVMLKPGFKPSTCCLWVQCLSLSTKPFYALMGSSVHVHLGSSRRANRPVNSLHEFKPLNDEDRINFQDF